MAKTATVKTTDTDISDDVQPGVFGRMFRFLREVISELKKVTTPTRKELAIYFFGVLFFVVFMILFISGTCSCSDTSLLLSLHRESNPTPGAQ